MSTTDLRLKLNEARKAGDTTAMMLLQVILGECGTIKARTGKDPDDVQIENLIRGIRDKNNETLELIANKGREDSEIHLREENIFLNAMLPTSLTVTEIKVVLIEVRDQLLTAKSDGQATGAAMKFLKTKDLKVLGNDVKIAVEEMRKND